MDSKPTDAFHNAKSSRPHKNNARLLRLLLFTFLAGPLTLYAGIPQTIVFPETGPLLTTDAPITLQASATSGLAVSYSFMSPGGVAAIDGNTLTLSGLPGSVMIKASQEGDDTYDRAPDRYQSFVVGDASQRFVQIASGRSHIVGIRADGTLWAWGYNAFGQLGDGTKTSTSTPVQIGSETSWSFVACGGMHTLALRSDGSLWGWGNNYAGQLGDGTTTRIRNSPVQIGSDTNWASVACGDIHTVAVRSDGSLWAWGSNEDGKLGDGGTNRNSPTRIGSDTNWTMAACGLRHTVGFVKMVVSGPGETIGMVS